MYFRYRCSVIPFRQDKLPEPFHVSCVKGDVDIKLEKLGNDTSKALLTLHALTGCDTTGKFEGKSKQFWCERVYSGQIKMLRERCMKQLHLMLQDIPCLQRSSLKEKS